MTLTARVLRAGRAAAAIALLAPGCSSSFLTKQSASSYLILDSLLASTGREPDKLSNALSSDVLTYVKVDNARVPTVFADGFLASFQLAMKDPGSESNVVAPSATNFITITRYHVRFIRSDGRNTEGVDVPYAFDGALTLTVTSTAAGGASGSATLVRAQSKNEAPLKALVGLASSISTIAEVTFYGKDQTGRDVSVVGNISVNFSDWGDPQ